MVTIFLFVKCGTIKSNKKPSTKTGYLINIATPIECSKVDKINYPNSIIDSLCIKTKINNAIRNQLFICLEKSKNLSTIKTKKLFKNYPQKMINNTKCIPVYNSSPFYWASYNIINFESQFDYKFSYTIDFMQDNIFVFDTFNKIVKERVKSNHFILVKISNFSILQTPKFVKLDNLRNFPTEFYFAISYNSANLDFCISKSPISGPAYRYYAFFPLHPIFNGTEYKIKNLAYFFKSFNDTLPKSYIPFLRLSLYGNYSNLILAPENYPRGNIKTVFFDITHIKSEKGFHHYGFYSDVKKKDMVVIIDTKHPEKIKVKIFKAKNYINR